MRARVVPGPGRIEADTHVELLKEKKPKGGGDLSPSAPAAGAVALGGCTQISN